MALLEDSLIAQYRLNDNLATDVILDETGNHNGAVKDATGTATSAFHSVAGKINLAQELDGVDDYIEIPDSDDFTPTLTPFSISAWINMDNVADFVIVLKGIFNTNGEWRFRTAGSKLRFQLFDESVPNCSIGRGYNTVLTAYANQWIHTVVTYDGGAVSAGIKLYLNGLRVDDVDVKNAVFVSVENLNGFVWIGREDGLFANGTIDNVMFFSKELTALEVQQLYNSGAGVENIPTGIDLSRTGQRFSSFPEN